MKDKTKNKKIALKVLEEFSMEDKGNYFNFMQGMIFSDRIFEYQFPSVENFKEWLTGGNVKISETAIKRLKEKEKEENIVFCKKLFKVSLWCICLFGVVIILNKWR